MIVGTTKLNMNMKKLKILSWLLPIVCLGLIYLILTYFQSNIVRFPLITVTLIIYYCVIVNVRWKLKIKD